MAIWASYSCFLNYESQLWKGQGQDCAQIKVYYVFLICPHSLLPRPSIPYWGTVDLNPCLKLESHEVTRSNSIIWMIWAVAPPVGNLNWNHDESYVVWGTVNPGACILLAKTCQPRLEALLLQLPLHVCIWVSLEFALVLVSRSCHHAIITKPSCTVTNVIFPWLTQGLLMQWLCLVRGSSPRCYSHSPILCQCSTGLWEFRLAQRIPRRFLELGEPSPWAGLMNHSGCQLELDGFHHSVYFHTQNRESYRGNLIQADLWVHCLARL